MLGPATRRSVPLVALAALSLLSALWAALARIGIDLPALPLPVVASHGALMIGGFFGTLVSLERATALGKRWGYLAPLLTVIGALALMAGVPQLAAGGLAVLGALVLVAIYGVFYRRQPAPYVATMGIGALLWLAGNTLWWFGALLTQVVPWWAGFLVLTIAGERLELSRLARVGRIGRITFNAAVALLVLGLALTQFDLTLGLALSGAGLLGLGLWLLRNDIARRTIRLSGLPRFIAACLLPGYGWLALGGALWLLLGGAYTTSPFIYDAMLHTLFLGFVVSMIFGHAPIILPAVLHVGVAYRPQFYVHLVLLHLGLFLRVAGDLLVVPPWRLWGGVLNVVALLIFLPLMVLSLERSKKDEGGR
jgi:hypothetical protein